MTGALTCAEAAEGTSAGTNQTATAKANDSQRAKATITLCRSVSAPSLIQEALVCNAAVVAATLFVFEPA
jgi:hypothetical protein